MAQYDVHRRLNVAPDDPIPYLLVLQADHVDRLGTLLVAPMERTSESPARIVQVPVYFNAERLLVLINEMGAIRRTALGRQAGSLAAHEYDFKRALDFLLFSG